MTHIEILENSLLEDYKRSADRLLYLEKTLVEYHYSWLNLVQTKSEILGKGTIYVNGERFDVLLRYSPFLPGRFDRIFIDRKDIEFSSQIHLYRDMSLCLYHPLLDKPLFKIIPLFKMIPWISEWCVHYLEWKKYGVWLGKEIAH
ncbi:MAG: hypothetical protein JST62_07280 [Bacteroidetes bacterium]|nr:hypothetical protein [Bacteroidota bacterium]